MLSSFRIVCELLRLTVIVSLSVLSGIAVALLAQDAVYSRAALVLFISFAIPIIIAWLLFRTIPSFYHKAASVKDSDNRQKER